MSTIPDFSDEEFNVVRDTVKERFRQDVPIEPVDTELRLYKDDRELTECPALYWQVGECHFLLAKMGDSVFHCQFFYSVRDQYGTGIDRFDDILNAVTTLLQVQADHESQRQDEPNSQPSE